ncbi:galactose mutarotase [Paroceanicella profunda]|uniref:Aldose 1-epimerase n=1 Tax=Paroceanicella profunda TaxID=2579971 RepID=A0A5B8FVX5_9RHOB|nr:aldose epimerase family protein [Paroceanicella profunda]QDL92986.1 galactose mutarotase [Paroceanicella profunda]
MIELHDFDRFDGRTVREAVLEDGPTRISLLDYGCVLRDWRLDGVPMVLGFESIGDHRQYGASFGIIAGRVANRIARGRFTLEGQDYQLAINNGPNHLHGGLSGLGRRIWSLEPDSANRALRFSYRSPDGEDGYPGTVDFEVIVSLSGKKLTYRMRAMPDRLTPINLAQHAYYTLGEPDVRGHDLRLDAEAYTPVDDTLIPTGEIAPVAGTRFDFRQARRIADADPEASGHDHNFVLRPDRDRAAPAAELRFGARHLRLWTDQPGIQLYTAPHMDVPVPGLDGRRYGAFAGLCLEAQHFPDSLNQPGFPSILHDPEHPYEQVLEVEIA